MLKTQANETTYTETPLQSNHQEITVLNPMATQLSSQLRKIRVVNADIRDTSSILFSTKEAGTYNMQSIFSIGRNGIMELIRIDDRFSRFDDTLFGNRMSSTDRMRNTEKENAEIDVLIQDYLFSVAPYMLLKCVQKTLEYLIRRFSIHIFNAEDFFLVTLPYHENPLFPRVFSILSFKTPLFEFLKNVKTSGTTIVRSTISIQCIKDHAFLEFILSGIKRINARSTIPVVHLTMVCSIIVDLIRNNQLSELYVRTLIGFASLGFSSPNSEFQATSLLILAQMAISVTLNDEIITACITGLLRVPNINMTQLMECLLLLFRSNKDYIVPMEPAKLLLSNHTFSSIITTLSQKVSVFPIIKALSMSLYRLLIEDSAFIDQLKTLATVTKEVEMNAFMNVALSTLGMMVNERPLSEKETDNLQKVILVLSGQFAGVYDSLISELPNDSPLKTISSKLFYGSSHMILSSGRTLFLSIDNHEHAVRLEVCTLLKQQLISSNHQTQQERDFIKNSLMSLLEDDFLDVSLDIVSIPVESLMTVYSNTELVLVLFDLLGHDRLVSQVSVPAAAAVVTAVFELLRKLDVASAFTVDMDTKVLSIVCLLYTYLLDPANAAFNVNCMNVLICIPHVFAQIDAKMRFVDSSSLCSYVASVVVAAMKSNDNIKLSLVNNLRSTLSSSPVTSLFFLHVSLRIILLLDNTDMITKQALACIISVHAMGILTNVPEDITSAVKMTEDEIKLCTMDSLSTGALQTEVLDRVRFMVNCLFVCATEITWNLNDIISCYEAVMAQSAHPLSILRFCFVSFTPKKGYYMALANRVSSTVWPAAPFIPFTTLLSCSSEQFILSHSLNKLMSYVDAQSTISASVFESILLAVLPHLTSSILSTRSTALAVLDGAKLKLSSDGEKKTIVQNSTPLISTGEIILSEEEKITTLVKLVNYIISYRNDIRDDGKIFQIKINLLLRTERPALAPSALAAVLLQMILSLESIEQRLTYLTIFQNLPYDTAAEDAVLKSCRETFNLFQTASVSQTVVPKQIINLWQLELVLFFKAMSQTMAYQKEYRSLLNLFMTADIQVNRNTTAYAPLSDVLRLINNEVFGSMNIPERLSLLHAMMCVVPHNHDVDAVQVYDSINHLDLSFSLLVEEAKALVSSVMEDDASELLSIQLITVFIEVVTRNPVFGHNLQTIDPLLLLLDRLITIIKRHAPVKEEEKIGDMEIEFDVGDSMVAMSDLLVVHYPIQLLLECLLGILKETTSNVRVITGTQTLQGADESQPPAKRARRNSINITTEIDIQPRVLVELINLNLTTQIKKTCLQLLSELSSVHSDTMDTYLFACFEDLSSRVITSQDEESFDLILNVVRYCLTKFKKEEQLFQIYKIFLSCVPYVPYSKSIELLNSLIQKSFNRYIGHIMAYLLLLSHGLSINPINPANDTVMSHSVTDNSSIYRFITSVFMGIGMTSQIQAISVLACFADYVTDSHRNVESMTANTNKITMLAGSLIQSLPMTEWCEKEEVCLGIAKTVLKFIKDVVSDTVFINNVTTAKAEESRIQPFFIHIIEYLLIVLQNCFMNSELISSTSRGRSKTDEELSFLEQYVSMETTLYDTITVCSEVLTVPSLLAVLAVLMKHDDSNVRKRALLMLNKKIEERISTFTTDEKMMFLSFLQNLNEICVDDKELSVNKQTALLSIHILTQYFGERFAERFIPSVQTVVSIVSQTNDTSSTVQALKGTAYIALSMLCSKLGVRMLPFLPKFLPSLLQELELTTDRLKEVTKQVAEAESASVRALTEQKDELFVLAQSLLATLTSVVSYQGTLLSTYLRRIVVVAVSPLLIDAEKPVVKGAVRVLFDLLSEKIDTRLLLPAIYDAYTVIDPLQRSSICGLYLLLKLVFNCLPEDKVESVSTKAWSFCVTGLETRSRYDDKQVMSSQDIALIEQSVVDALVCITLKLNETQLNTLFIQTVTWMEEKSVMNVDVTGEGKHVTEQTLPPISKAIPFFALMNALSEKLKSIFTNYFSQVLEIIIGFMTAFSKTCRKEKMARKVQDEESSFFRLVKSLVLSMYQCFKYDTEGWVDEDKFKAISTPLVKLLGSYYVPNYTEEYGKFMSNFVIPTLVQLILCTKGHDDWWMQYTHELLLQTRSPINAVKMAAMRVIRENFDHVSTEYIPLLPDIIPFLADLLEDENSEVEKMAQDLRVKMETVSGEELSSYLTM